MLGKSRYAARLTAAFALCTTGALGQSPLSHGDGINTVARARPLVEAPAAVVRVDSSLVLIQANVTDAIGAPQMGLRRENFRLSEDGDVQTIVHFNQEDAPVSVGVLFDASGSMRNKIQKSAEAAASFFKTANPEDEFFLVKFNDRAKIAVPFTSDSGLVFNAIANTRAIGQTSLLDAVYLALGQMRKARNQRKALVIISDGGDNWSRHSIREVTSALSESDVVVYALGIFDADYGSKHPAEERRGPGLLKDLAEQTGGRHLPVTNINDLPAISARVGLELRNQYVLGYYSTNEARDGKYRKTVLQVTAPELAHSLRTSYRHGYYAPER